MILIPSVLPELQHLVLGISMILPRSPHAPRLPIPTVSRMIFLKTLKKDLALEKEETKWLLLGRWWRPFAIRTQGRALTPWSRPSIRPALRLVGSCTEKISKKLKFQARGNIQSHLLSTKLATISCPNTRAVEWGISVNWKTGAGQLKIECRVRATTTHPKRTYRRMENTRWARSTTALRENSTDFPAGDKLQRGRTPQDRAITNCRATSDTTYQRRAWRKCQNWSQSGRRGKATTRRTWWWQRCENKIILMLIGLAGDERMIWFDLLFLMNGW